MDDAIHDSKCGGCGEELPQGATICRQCGWDLTASLARPQPVSVLARLRSGGVRLLVYVIVITLPILGFMRLRTTGPGPDLATTLKWMALGDGGRSAELVTIHRAHEIGSAASRYAIRHIEAPPFEGDWAPALAPFATMMVRGWIPMLFYGADTGLAPRSVRELYTVRSVDGWGHPYRVHTRFLERSAEWAEDPQVVDDLAQGLQASFFTRGEPDFEDSDWVALRLESAGRDGAFDTADDLRMVSYVQAGLTVRLLADRVEMQRQLDRAYTIGRHYFRIEGSRWDLIDARILAEFRLKTLAG